MKAELISALEEVWDSLITLGKELEIKEWDFGTECPGWSVKDQFSHIIGTESILLGLPTPEIDISGYGYVKNGIGLINEAWIEQRRGHSGAEVLSEFASVVQRRIEQLEDMPETGFEELGWSPIGEVSYGRFMQVRIFDLWVHEQDVRFVTHREGHLDGLAVQYFMAEVERALGYIVGKKAEVPDGSSIEIQFSSPIQKYITVVVDGMGKVISERVSSPTALLRLDFVTFVRLITGRLPSQIALDEGMVHLAGDTELARKVISNFAFVL